MCNKSTCSFTFTPNFDLIGGSFIALAHQSFAASASVTQHWMTAAVAKYDQNNTHAWLTCTGVPHYSTWKNLSSKHWCAVVHTWFRFVPEFSALDRSQEQQAETQSWFPVLLQKVIKYGVDVQIGGFWPLTERSSKPASFCKRRYLTHAVFFFYNSFPGIYLCLC